MTVFRKHTLLLNHSSFRLTLTHAAYVDSYPVHDVSVKLPVNRFLFVCKSDAHGASRIHDPADDRTLDMRADNVYFIPCNRPVDLDIAPDLQFYSLQFNLYYFFGFDALEICPHCEERPVPELVKELGDLMANESELATLLRINEIIYGLCTLLTPSFSRVACEQLIRSRKYERALDFVRRQADATTTVETLATLCAMRNDVFSRSFTRDLGVPPKEFLSDALVRKASELLLTPGHSVKDVARILNFSSPYYFSHFFKRRTGHTPIAFRRLNGSAG